MVERFLKLLITLAVLLFLLQSVTEVLVHGFVAILSNLVGAFVHVGSFLSAIALTVGLFCLTVGLLLRAYQFTISRDPRAARERAARERSVRQRVRRPAEDAPPFDHWRHDRPDPDPAIGDDRGDR